MIAIAGCADAHVQEAAILGESLGLKAAGLIRPLKETIIRGAVGDNKRFPVFRDPSGNTLPSFKADCFKFCPFLFLKILFREDKPYKQMDYRIRKQITIVAIAVLFFVIAGAWLYFVLKSEPTCFDGIKNQDEEEIDCGGKVCPSCEIKTTNQPEVFWVKAISSGGDFYDLVAKIRNPNPNFGAAEMKYYFEIKDNGVGIPKEDQKYIFQKFFRSKNIMRYQTQGIGLGLYISKLIIEKLRGRIWFKSREGVGSTFWFTLPIK